MEENTQLNEMCIFRISQTLSKLAGICDQRVLAIVGVETNGTARSCRRWVMKLKLITWELLREVRL